jgi:hypothetical protein
MSELDAAIPQERQRALKAIAELVWDRLPDVRREMEQRQLSCAETRVMMMDTQEHSFSLVLWEAGERTEQLLDEMEEPLPESQREVYRNWRQTPAAGLLRCWVGIDRPGQPVICAAVRVPLLGAPSA